MEYKKLIIENRTDLSMLNILDYVAAVINKGRISNNGKQYCYGMTFEDGIVVYSGLNKISDRIVVTKVSGE